MIYTGKPNKYSTGEICIILILTISILLSLWQFLFNRSLWLDEASLALNIIHKSSLELLKPLDYDQVAPILFLQIEKFFSTIWPDTEYGLRIFPLLCFWLSIYFFYKIVRIYFHCIYTLVAVVSLFALNPTLIYYSSEVKQYMTDVMVLLALFYFLLKDYNTEKNKYYILGITGVLAIFLSNVTPIILCTCGLYLLYEQFFVKKSKKLLPLFLVFAIWLFFFSLYYLFFIYNHPLRDFMMRFWFFNEAFLPLDKPVEFLITKIKMILTVLSSCYPGYSLLPNFILDAGFYGTAAILLASVFILLQKKKVPILILTFTPILLHLFLSAFQLYPFEKRLILYTFSCLIMVCAFGYEFIFKVVFPKLKMEKFSSFVVVIISIIFLLAGRPVAMETEEIKKSIKYIEGKIEEDEKIYLYFGAQRAYKYYEDIGFMNIKADIIEGNYNRHGALFEFGDLDEFEQLSGKNWLLFAHVFAEEPVIINRLDSIGAKKLYEFKTVGSSAYLYDFGETSK
jgi:hypothetical protein